MWRLGDINGLILEGRVLQHCLQRACFKTTSHTDKITRLFTKFMFQGKVKAALQLLHNESDSKGGMLPLNSKLPTGLTVSEELISKHPIGQPIHPSAFCHFLLQNCQVILSLDGASIRAAALHTNGSAGPSGLDALGWRRLCTSFQRASTDLCNSLTLVARKICTTYVDPQSIAALTANRPIALDKCPGVRPIGVGEIVRRIISKAVLSVIKSDVLEAALQLCAGHEAGCEAAIHSMCRIFHDAMTETVLLFDANNAFNSFNCKVALLNIHQLCPSLATILTNNYRENASLFIDGDTLFSQEGTTQGDPLAMAMYAVATVPLIEKLQSTNTKQVWYADDATAGGTLMNLKAWWTMLSSSGPSYGYFVNPGKPWLIVKPQHEHDAKELFSGTGIRITSEGKRSTWEPFFSRELHQRQSESVDIYHSQLILDR